jgi:hypothetical protein
VALSQGPKLLRTGINRLVAQTFLPAPTDPSLTHLLPLDGNHLNLAADNWQWVSVEQTGAVVAERRRAAGQAHHAGRFTPTQRATIQELVAAGRTLQSVADEYQTSRPTIWRIARQAAA